MDHPTSAHPRRILLTGATGFLGSNLLRRLVASGDHLVVLKRSFSNCSRLEGVSGRLRTYDIDRVHPRVAFEENAIDYVVHCATNYGRASVAPTDVIEANLVLPLTLLQLAADHQVIAFVNTDTVLDKRVNHYSLSKHQFLEWLPEFASRLACVNVALEHFYGPHDDPTKFVSFVVQQLLACAPRIALTPGTQRRDFVFIDDVVSAFTSILTFARTSGSGVYHFEVGSGQSISIADFVQTAKALSGNTVTDLDFGALPHRPREVMDSRANISQLVSLGWMPRTSLEEGLLRTITLDRDRLLRCVT